MQPPCHMRLPALLQASSLEDLSEAFLPFSEESFLHFWGNQFGRLQGSLATVFCPGKTQPWHSEAVCMKVRLGLKWNKAGKVSGDGSNEFQSNDLLKNKNNCYQVP